MSPSPVGSHPWRERKGGLSSGYRSPALEFTRTLYVPRHFTVTDQRWVIDLIAEHPFGLLITCDGEYPSVSHIPLIARQRDEELWIFGHVARANPQTRSILAQAPATLAFQGAHAYVSASWYEEPYATVPTWNYSAAQVCGRLQECDPRYALQLLTASVEGNGVDSWDAERLDPAYRDSQIRGILAFELRAERIYAKAKLSQNRSEADRRRVISRLRTSDDQTDRECAAAMAEVSCLESRGGC